MSGILIELGLKTADTVVHNSQVLFCWSLLVVMQSEHSVVCKHCCVVMLFTVVFFSLFSMF